MKKEFIPDPFLYFVVKQSIRILAVLLAIGIITVAATIVFNTISGFIDSIHGAGHAFVALLASVGHVYVESGLGGQFFVVCILFFVSCMVIYRGAFFLFSYYRVGVA